MWKALGILLVVILVAAAGGIYYLASHLPAIVKASIEEYGSAAAGTRVTLDGVDLSVKDGSAALNGLRIANPSGYSSSSALSAAKIAVAIDPQSIMASGPILIREVLIEAPDISYEAGLSGSNLSVIEKNITDYANSLTGGRTSKSAAKGKERKLVIRDLYVRRGNIKVSHSALKGEKLAVALPELHLHNIGKSSNGATYAEVSRQVLGAIIGSASRTAARALISRVGPIGNIVSGTGSGLKNSLGGLLGRP
jgi:hypothetical protein